MDPESPVPKKYAQSESSSTRAPTIAQLQARMASATLINTNRFVDTSVNSEPSRLAQMRERLKKATPINAPKTSTSFELRPPHNGLEAQSAQVYASYFGPNWQQDLAKYLFIDIHSATDDERRETQAIGNFGWLGTHAEVSAETNGIRRNHITIFSNPGDFELRTEIGESLYNLIENVSVTGKIPDSHNLGIPTGLEALMRASNGTATVDFCRQLLDRWNAVYTQKPNRYAGMNPDSKREYLGIPEWKSEGFSDGIAVEIKRRSGQSLDTREQQIWGSFNFSAQDILQKSVTAFLPPIVQKPS